MQPVNGMTGQYKRGCCRCCDLPSRVTTMTRLAVLAAASDIDKLNAPEGGRDGFRFFHRTSAELCAAITEPRPGSAAILSRHLDRMTDERMKRAFAAAVELNEAKPVQKTTGAHNRSRLWKGLATPGLGTDRL
jgi:hypothetical protein